MKQGCRKVIINVDAGGVGESPAIYLLKNGYPCNRIMFGSSAADTNKFANLRAEMWGRMRDWLDSGGCIPNDEDLIADLTGLEYDVTTKGQIILEKKKDMKKRGLASPDIADALALTFSVRVNEYLQEVEHPVIARSQTHRSRDPYRGM